MKVHALLNLYNDRMFLVPMLESMRDRVDNIIVADGAYQLYYKEHLNYNPNAKPWSTDGSLELIKCLPDLPPIQHISCPNNEPWPDQCAKRNALLDAVPIDDWLIIIDADEMLVGDVKTGMQRIEASGCIVGHAPLYNVGLDEARLFPAWHARIYQKTEGLHYYGTHWYLRDSFNRVVETNYPMKWINNFVFVHLKWLKSMGRLVSHDNYMRDMKRQGWVEPKQTQAEVK